MSLSKKIIIAVLAIIVIAAIAITVIFTNKEKNVEGNLEDLMSKVYENIPEDERPMMLTNIEINEENVEGFLGTADIKFEEAIASESEINVVAHSVVLLRTQEGANAKKIAKKIEGSIDPRKWVCVEAEKCIVKSKGDLVILIMTSNENAQKIEASFNSL